MEYLSKSAAQTQKIGSNFAKKLTAPVVIGLFGDLGSGKTTFVQGMAKGLGINPNYYVNSPTFTMVNEYKNLIHVDLYRIEKPTEVETLALEEYAIPGNIVVIEWAEKMSRRFDFEVHFEQISDKERRIEII